MRPAPYMPAIVADHLDVRYQGSLAPQELALTFDGRVDFIFPVQLQTFWSLAEAGALGGVEFAPEAGRCKLLEGPTGPAKDGARGKWVWRVSGVSAEALRPLLYQLPIYQAPPGMKIITPRLSLVGTAPITDPERAVDVTRLRAWAAAPGAFAGAWPELLFPIRQVRSKSGLGMAITLKAAPTASASARLVELAERWTNGAWAFPLMTGARSGPAAFLGDKRSWKGATYTLSFPKASLIGAAPLALLSNLLRRFHLEVAPVAELQFASLDASGDGELASKLGAAPKKTRTVTKPFSTTTHTTHASGASWDRVALVTRVIESIAKEDVPEARPIGARQLAGLTLPGDRPLPPSLRTWLAFDSAWFFATTKKPTWHHEKVSAMLRRMWDLEGDTLAEELEALDAKLPAGGLLLPQSAKQQHVLYLGQIDDDGEHPILAFEDTPDDAWVKYAGFDAFVAHHFGKEKLPKEHARRCKDHERALGL